MGPGPAHTSVSSYRTPKLTPASDEHSTFHPVDLVTPGGRVGLIGVREHCLEKVVENWVVN